MNDAPVDPHPLIPAGRIIAVDFWRGLCLLMIFIDHVPNSPLGMITLRSLGFSDAAEIFVFLAGFSATLAFSRYFLVGGFLCGTLRVFKRTWELFCAHVLLVFAGAATFAVANGWTDSKPVMEQMNFSPFFVETDTALLKLFKLSYMPNLTDILPIYILFVGMFPLLWLLLRVSPWLALALSGSLWLWANLAHFSMANYPEGTKWFFSPPAWQLIFVMGAILYVRQEQIKRWVSNKYAVLAGVAMLIAAFVAVAPWAQFEALSAYRLMPAEFLTDQDKQFLSIIRIMHFLALAIISYRLLPPTSRFWKNRLVFLVSLCGRHALPIYCVGVIAALIIDIFIGTQSPTMSQISGFEVSGVALLMLLAYGLHGGRLVLRRAESGRAPHAP